MKSHICVAVLQFFYAMASSKSSNIIVLCLAQIMASISEFLLFHSSFLRYSFCAFLPPPRVWVRGCRIGPLRFLAGWHQAFSFVLVKVKVKLSYIIVRSNA